MALVCRDLSEFGVVLIPPGADEYAAGPAVILVNRADLAVVALGYTWQVRVANGDVLPHHFRIGTNPSVLLPYYLPERLRKYDAYWNTIFPGSKRMLTPEGMFGDNTDVRPPAEDEVRRGSGIGFGRGGSSQTGEPVALELDGVFFADGGFAGPNRYQGWERMVAAREAYLRCARLARESGSALELRVQLEEFTGYYGDEPPRPTIFLSASPEQIQHKERWSVGQTAVGMCKQMPGPEAMAAIAAWADMPAPKLHRLDAAPWNESDLFQF